MRKLFTPQATTRLATALGVVLLTVGPAAAQTVYGLLTAPAALAAPSLVTFSATAPGTFTAARPITGLTVGQTLVGLDARPNTGQLFALGYNPTGTQSQLYILDPATGALTTVGAALTTVDLGSITNRIGFDFNPTVDRIRVTGSNNANLRLNPNNGALVDGNAALDGVQLDRPLNYNPGNATATPVVLADVNAGQTPVIGSIAYANSFIGATTTVLYDLDEAKSLYTTQNPPNDGVLNSRGTLSVSTAAALATDLDIYFNPTTRTNTGYLTIASGTSAAPATQLYTLSFMTGADLTAVGAVGPTGSLVSDIAFAIERPAVLPAVTGQLAYALAGTNLLTFDTTNPSLIRTAPGITGVDATYTLVGMDVRPLTNTLFALAYRASDQMAQLYTLNPGTGAATTVGTPLMLALGTATDAIGFDFNPLVDRIRVVSTNRANLRLNPITGALVDGNATTDGVQPDGQLTYNPGNATATPAVPADANAGAVPAIATGAYTNSFVSATPPTSTVLYDYDRALNILAIQAPPNDGILNTVGSLGLTLSATTPSVSLDIYSSGLGANTAYLVANMAGSTNSSLYTVDLSSRVTTLVGLIGGGSAVRDIAVAAATGVVVTGARRQELATGLGLYPNPFAGLVQLRFELARAADVQLLVSDALGRHVATVPAGKLAPGAHTLRWNSAGQRTGLYFFRLQFNGQPAGTRAGVLAE